MPGAMAQTQSYVHAMPTFSLTESWRAIAPTAPHREVRRTKIVCTLGPATTEPDAIVRLAEAGMDVARLNFSHGTHEQHLARLHAVRAAERETNRPMAVLPDLCGPRIRG